MTREHKLGYGLEESFKKATEHVPIAPVWIVVHDASTKKILSTVGSVQKNKNNERHCFRIQINSPRQTQTQLVVQLATADKTKFDYSIQKRSCRIFCFLHVS